jgi:hypothetical protein
VGSATYVSIYTRMEHGRKLKLDGRVRNVLLRDEDRSWRRIAASLVLRGEGAVSPGK